MMDRQQHGSDRGNDRLPNKLIKQIQSADRESFGMKVQVIWAGIVRIIFVVGIVYVLSAWTWFLWFCFQE